MKRFWGYFLFQSQPDQGLSCRHRVLFWLWNALLLTLAATALGLTSLALAPGQRGWLIFWDYFSHPSLVALNLLPPIALSVLLYGLTGRGWLAYILTALPVVALTLGNYYKLAFRDDPVVAADLLILGEAGQMAGNYQLFLSKKLVAALLLPLLSALLLAMFARGKPRWPTRGIVSTITLVVILSCTPLYTNASVYASNAALEHLTQWSSTQQYLSRGLLYPFLHSITDALPTPPEGYSVRNAEALLAQYEDAVIPADKKVNVVGVMLEAFADFSQYEQIQFQQDVYALYHDLEAESYSGTLLTNIFAGGTIDTERAFLTGIPSGDYDYRSNASSYAWYLKSQGYHISGDHPANEWFYNRRNVNRYLGFDNYRFSENYYAQFTGGVANDPIFLPELTASILTQLEEHVPLFSFSVSYQGHGPYSGEECWWGEVDDFIANHDLDQESRTILSNYFGSLMSTQQELTKMVDAFRASDEPIVLVLFGDHKPWLGNNNAVYNALGIDLSQSDLDSFHDYWATSYLIWANDAAKEQLGTDLVGEGPTISPCFLMNVLFEQLGWEGDAYMQAVESCWKALPVIHVSGSYLTADGTLTRSLPEGSSDLVKHLTWLSYYRSRHFSS